MPVPSAPRLLRAALALLIGLAGVAVVATPAHAATLTQVSSFGSNPGNLSMYSYRPDGLASGRPAVVLLHGCTQNANAYFTNSGWRKYADLWGFALIVAEQKSGNNSLSCFNWFQAGDIARGQGEALSVKQMVDYAKTNYGTDASRVYVSGLSAGGAMSAVMLAAYPDVFKAGSVVAGIPYNCGTACQGAAVSKTPQQWGDLVRNAYPGFGGPWPRVAIWQGQSDTTVVPANGTELMTQWTNVRGASQAVGSTSSLPGNTTLETYASDAVRLYKVAGMGHGTPVDPGSGVDQCGTAASYFLDTICSAYRDALFFGLDGGGTTPTPPGAPTGLSVTGVTDTSVALSWTAVSGATGYHVYRGGTKLTSSPVTGAAYTATGLSAGTAYTFTVTAVSASGESGQSAPVSATTTGGTTPPVCYTASNYAQVAAGRAYHSLGYAYANGSNQNMGLYNTFYTHTLKQTGPDYWVIADGQC
ncbi:PHB depolymerase family esterase [Catellatospora bangladeshensis]|uniref:Feruloyl esterase n=1 Tax=Catellatospora bangladeshensis TaxID=310355 RepID=A0A8J3JKQ5_9ACTN|nr:PHB depolymerase family esterase [Catellatospora bangladeshensis]GIF78909.1 feruloyl esterase [Catellatospora bangladeshensis]